MANQHCIAVAGSTGMIGSYMLAGLGEGGAPVPRELLASSGELADWLRTCGARLLVNAVGSAGKDWDVLRRANVVLAGTLARAASRAGIACVYLGSARVFDAARPGLREEGESPDPVDPYGRSKALGERAVREVPDGGRHVILRLPMVLGLRERGRDGDGQMATRLLARARKGQPVRVATDAFSQIVYADTVTEAVLALWEAGVPGGVYHLTSVGHVSLFTLMSRIFAGCGLETPGTGVCADFEPDAPGPRWQLLAPGRLATLVPPQPWETAVDRFVAALGSDNTR